MAPSQQDAFMEDSEDTCPLCVEEFDLSDKNFRPCPCGYQICQFCYNNIKTNMNGLCPACRRPYDEKNIEWKIVSPEEFKADVASQARRKAAARQKEAERRQVETLNRKHLQGLRVVQRNLVYITGMSSEGVSEDLIEEQLRSPAVFGQYGRIIKLSANKLKETGSGSIALAIFITFADEDAASRCIAALDGTVHQGRILKAQHGTTKYCSAFLRNEVCNNRNCTFLHETGEDRDSFSRQELSSLNAASSQSRPAQSTTPAPRPPPPQQTPSATAGPSTQPMSRSDSGDGPALPSTANWAKNPQLQQSRRSSLAASRATPSPKITHAKTILTRPASRTSSKAAGPSNANKEREANKESRAATASSGGSKKPGQTPAAAPVPDSFVRLYKAVEELVQYTWDWSLDKASLDEEMLRTLETHPPLIDPNGGAARALLKQRQERMRLKQDEVRSVVQAPTITDDDDHPLAGSLQLGGEPDIGEDGLESRNRGGVSSLFQHQPFDNGTADTSPFGQSAMTNDFSSIDNVGRAANTQSRSGGVSLLKHTPAQDHDGLLQQFQRAPTTSQHQSTLSNPFQGQNPVLSGHSRHGRQSSRFTFANDASNATASVKSTANPLLQQQSGLSSNQSKQFSGQPNMQTGFYSGVQGPPPGLKSSGTPPISGPGMFGQGHSFANAMGGSLNFGSHLPGKSGENDSLMMRGRAGTGGGLGQDAGKREFNFSPPPIPYQVSSLASLKDMYGPRTSSPAESTERPQSRQHRRKGKKHRQANLSSAGGNGTVDVADPSILRMQHHNSASQGPYGATQGQEFESTAPAYDPLDLLVRGSPRPILRKPKLESQVKSRSATPSLPPGLATSEFPPLAPPKLKEYSSPATAKEKPTAKAGQQSSVRKGKQKETSTEENQEQQDDGVEKQEMQAGAGNDSTCGETAQIARASAKLDSPAKAAPDSEAALVRANVQMAVEPKENLSGKGAEQNPQSPTERRQKPGKLDIAAAQDAAKQDFGPEKRPAKSSIMATADKPETTSAETGPSRSATPATAAETPTPGVPVNKGPRTLRLVDTTKAETPSKAATKTPAPETTPVSASVAGTKASSRRPSVGSINVPSTPSNELHSETASWTESRPASPTGGKLPTRVKTKSQAKKERRARKTEESKLSESVSVDIQEAEIVQEAIVGRKKKAKKEKAPPVKPSTKVTDNSPTNIEESSTKASPENQPRSTPPASAAPAEKESEHVSEAPKRPLTIKERLERLTLADVLQSYTRSFEHATQAAEMLTAPPSWKTATGARRVIPPPLTKEQNAQLNAKKPILTPTRNHPDDGPGSGSNDSNPYSWCIILPNLDRTVLPMSSHVEGELYLSLYEQLSQASPSMFGIGASNSQPMNSWALPDRINTLLHHSPFLTFYSLWETYPSHEGPTLASARPSDRSGNPAHINELIRTDAAAAKWMDENEREIDHAETLAGGDYFERRRAAALGHGPISLDSVAAAAPPGEFVSVASPGSAAQPPVSAPKSKSLRHKQYGASRSLAALQNDLDALLRSSPDWLRMPEIPLDNQDLLEELRADLGLSEAEIGQRLKASEEFAKACKKDEEAYERRVASMVKKNTKAFRKSTAIGSAGVVAGR